MGSFRLGGMTLGSLFKRPETLRYPFEVKEPPQGLKGHIVNDVSRCIVCGICARVCPAGALAVDRKARTWAIDPFRCVQCASCVAACPKGCLAMAPEATGVAAERYDVVLEVHEQPKGAEGA